MKVCMIIDELKSLNEELEKVTERVSSLHDITFSLGDKLQIVVDDEKIIDAKDQTPKGA